MHYMQERFVKEWIMRICSMRQCFVVVELFSLRAPACRLNVSCPCSLNMKIFYVFPPSVRI